MTALLVLITFTVLLLVDAWVRRREAATAAGATPVEAAGLVPEPVWVSGYRMPGELYYHRGHTWARPLGPDTAVIGLDDFARQLLGPASAVKLPAAGSWLEQGAGALKLTAADGEAGERQAELLSPIDGEVLATNPQLRDRPDLATREPYGRGWLLKVRSADLGRDLRNLFSGSLARRFMEDSRERLQHQLMALSGSVLADGGEPTAEFARHLPDEDWRRLVHEFLLT